MNLPKLTSAVEYDIVSSIIAVNSREVIFRRVNGYIDCPACAGNDPFCGTCGGEGRIDSEQSVTMSGTVRWKSGEDKIYLPNGQYIEGDCLVVIASSGSDDLLSRVRYVQVDDRQCIVDRWYYKGTPRNRVYIVLKEDEALAHNRI
jgi:hypothetical protein